MLQLETRVADSMARYALAPHGASLVVAVSGGADSVALLLLLAALRDQADYRLVVAHLNHSIREEAAMDARFVQELAASLDLPCQVAIADVPALAATRSISLEMAAREARYEFLEQVARQHGATRIAIAHHADDQAETLLLNLMAGTGTRGASGMQPARKLGQLDVIRPLLEIPKEELLSYLRDAGQSWCEDVTNACLDQRRNRVRHRLLPLLRAEFNPAVVEALSRFAELRRDEEAWMGQTAHALLAICRSDDGRLQATELLALPPAAQRRVMRSWLQQGGLGERRLSLETIDRALGIANMTDGSCSHDLAAGWRLVNEYGNLRMTRKSPAPPLFRERPLAIPGTTPMDELGLRVTAEEGGPLRRDRHARPGYYPRFATLRSPRPDEPPLTVRTRRPGDRITPCGMQGSRKLKNVWIDLKVPEARRDAMPVVACGDALVWVPGYCVAAEWAVQDERADRLALTIETTP